MASRSNAVQRLGSNPAVILFANLVCLPIASKLKSIINEQLIMQEILVDGMAAIANGENPRFIESRLQGYCI